MPDEDKTLIINDGVTGAEDPNAKKDDAPPAGGEKTLAGKFKTPEELEAAYLELQKKLGERKPTEEENKEDQKADDKKPDTDEEPKLIVAGKDFTKYAKVFAEQGKLDEASYAELEKEGVPREVVDAYIAGNTAPKAAAKEVVDSIKAAVGGEENFQKIAEWAKTGLSKEEVVAYNKAIDTGDPDIMRMAVERLQSKYEAAYGKPPKLISGKPSNPQSEAFRSTAEVVAAMKDPRYANDPAYRADVEAKLARSNVF